MGKMGEEEGGKGPFFRKISQKDRGEKREMLPFRKGGGTCLSKQKKGKKDKLFPSISRNKGGIKGEAGGGKGRGGTAFQ